MNAGVSVAQDGTTTLLSQSEDISSNDKISESDAGNATDNGTAANSGNDVNDTYKDSVTLGEQVHQHLQGVGAAETASYDDSYTESDTEAQTGADLIKTGTGATTVNDTDNFNDTVKGSGTGSLHETFGMVSGNLTLTGATEKLTDQSTDNYSDSGSDVNGTGGSATGGAYTDSLTGIDKSSESITSSDGVNFTETQDETFSDNFKDASTPVSAASDSQTGNDKFTMKRVVSWGAAGTVSLVSATVGAAARLPTRPKATAPSRSPIPKSAGRMIRRASAKPG